MSCVVLFEEQVRVPFVNSLEEFRQWARSDDFPERGRIDYISGQIEINISPEELFTHSALRTEVASVIYARVKGKQSGYVFIGKARVSCPKAELSVEPDVVYLSNNTLDSGTVEFVPRSSEEPDHYVEIEGAPDLLVEIVGDASVAKDTERLPQKYFQAGVQELWLVDARQQPLRFVIHTRGKRGFVPAPITKDGFQSSAVLKAKYRLERCRDRKGWPLYELHERA